MIKQEDIDIKIKNLIDYELEKNMYLGKKYPKSNREQIYVLVADQVGVHKVMVRKVARKLMSDYINKIQILDDTRKRNLKTKDV